MSILDIRVYGDPILRRPTQPIAEITDEIRTLIDDMFETMHAADGVGLAAPQVGRSERLAIMEMDNVRYVMINPEIVLREGREKGEEGCLSIPDLTGTVERAEHIIVRALDEQGEPYQLEGRGLLARCVQHEIDHLDGKLYIDYLSVLKKKAFAREWEHEVAKYPNFIRKLDASTQHTGEP